MMQGDDKLYEPSDTVMTCVHDATAKVVDAVLTGKC